MMSIDKPRNRICYSTIKMKCNQIQCEDVEAISWQSAEFNSIIRVAIFMCMLYKHVESFVIDVEIASHVI